MLEWDNSNYRDNELPIAMHYKGHTFAIWKGRLTQEEYRSGRTYFALWGGGYASEKAIMYMVDEAIKRKQLQDAA